MKIFVVEPRGSGGMAHYAYQLCNALCSYVPDVTLVTAKSYELDRYPHRFHLQKLLNLWSSHDGLSLAPVQNRARRIGWNVFRKSRRVVRGVRLFFEWIKLTRSLIKARPEIVQFGEIEFPFEAIFLQILKSRGLVLTQICHEFEPREQEGGLLVQLNRRLMKHVFSTFSVIFFHSQSNVDRFRQLYPHIPVERLQVISMGNGQIFPSGEDHDRIKEALLRRYGITSTDKVVLFFGNLTPSKGIPDLLAAFAQVHAQNRQARLVIAGMPLKYINADSLLATASSLGIQTTTHFDLRYLPMQEVGPLIDLATVVIFPYISGTQSASIQAAYAFGKPVVATRVGGLPDVVVEGESGFLVEPHCPEQITAAILKVIADPELAEKMGRFARNLSETRFSWGPIAGNIVTIYQTIV